MSRSADRAGDPERSIGGLHHVTATVGEAQPDLDFYVGLLGLRLVKKTVNFDNRAVYHFYYGDERGSPGTIMTTFPYAGQGVREGVRGSGQVIATAFSVPAAALPFWRRRLADAGVEVGEQGARFGEPVLGFEDPAGLGLELVGCDDPRPPWTAGDLTPDEAVRGLHSVTLAIATPTGPTVETLTGVLGLDLERSEGSRSRLTTGDAAPGRYVDVLESPAEPLGVNGLGTVHHVALAIFDEAAQVELRRRLLDEGLKVTEVKDRKYFRSIYFRIPGGVLVEVATRGPGFTVDEPFAELGRRLELPPWEEERRDEIEQGLPPVDPPSPG